MGPLEEYCAAAFKSACIAELEALKPGNVHIFADGHGMTAQDFLRSAEAAAGPIARVESSVGERILHAIQATYQAVGCNTNLGIVLLAAPIIKAANLEPTIPFKERIAKVLNNLSQQDAAHAFEAIRIASPAGLGQREKHDVSDQPQCTLLQAMVEANEYDYIAKQYANGYQELFLGLEHYQRLLQHWQRPAWAITGLYLHFLANYPDSHIARKYGMEVSEKVKMQASEYESAFLACENPKTYMPELLKWDADLKSQAINPGTSADMTVSVILLSDLLNNSSINSEEVAQK
ncbi:MAG: triphosphoribosyl-dephospho-CoA synthase [Methylophilaceae bacterium]|nr:triphosphoribosyl-dephospho-CoA synthase [Methylophilaceae bacterium]